MLRLGRLYLICRASIIVVSECIPGWKGNIEPLKQDTLFWQSLWRSCPQHGFIAFNRKRARALYHRAIKKCQKERESILANKIVSAYVAKDITSLWRSVKKNTNVKESPPNLIVVSECIPGWKENIEPLKQDTLFWQSLWRSCPQHGFIAFNRKRARALYHRAIKKCQKERESILANKIVSAYVAKDITSLWRSVKKNTNVKESPPNLIDNAHGDTNMYIKHIRRKILRIVQLCSIKWWIFIWHSNKTKHSYQW